MGLPGHAHCLDLDMCEMMLRLLVCVAPMAHSTVSLPSGMAILDHNASSISTQIA